ncbi:sporozoite surface protein 2 [Plasmodium cynomolgi strain B]|uniref:Sporozoite surface protein 2 n=1 Tax=Plasmodium cynomolgi (strain B) TaxID=1120755 RepID=K6UE43_PLACD|nr:sporozoite surface protein 2 [Plasmodium cynomolgi strain B]GAB67701.1 sporozoite surface protein 2 [Plasmodium cynomolgi strain B]
MKLIQNKSYLLVVFLLYVSIFARGDQKIVDEVKYSEEVCNESVDLYLLVDGSGSIGYPNWVTRVIPMLTGLIGNLSLSRDAINLYMGLFASRTTELIRLGSGPSIEKKLALNAVADLKKGYSPYGATNMSSALEEVMMHLKDRVNREKAIQLVILLTDGIPNNKVRALELSKELKQKGVKLAVIGIGQGINHHFNRLIAGCRPREQHCKFYSHADWNEAVDLIKPFIAKVCTEVEKVANCGPWNPWTPCSVTCGKGTHSRSRPLLHDGCTTHMVNECDEGECPVEPEPIPVPAPFPAAPEDLKPRNTDDDDDDDHPNFHKGLDVPDVEDEVPPENDGTDGNPTEENDFPPKDDVVPDESNALPLPPVVPGGSNEEFPTGDENNPENPLNPENPANSEYPENPESPGNAENQEESPTEQEAPQDNNINEPERTDDKGSGINDKLIPKPMDNERDIAPNKKVHPSSTNHAHDRYARPHRHSGGNDNGTNANSDIPNNSGESEYEEPEDKGKKSSNNGYKIAGGVIAGLALVGCVGFAYNFVSSGGAAGMGGEPAPFDEAMAEEDKDAAEADQFKLPEDNDWN